MSRADKPRSRAKPAAVKRLTVRPGYEALAAVLDAALDDAQDGKGSERHSSGQPFDEQPIVVIGRWMSGSTAFAIGQAVKKSIESTRLEPAHARQQLLGAINYLAAAVITLEDRS